MCDRNRQLWSMVHSHTNVLIVISVRFLNETLIRTKMIILTWSRKYPRFLWLHLPPLRCSSTWHVFLQIDPLGQWGNLNSFCFSVFSLTLPVCMQFIGKIESACIKKFNSYRIGLVPYHILPAYHSLETFMWFAVTSCGNAVFLVLGMLDFICQSLRLPTIFLWAQPCNK